MSHTGPQFLTQATGRVGALGYLAAYSYVVATAAALSAIVDNSAYDPLADGTQGVVLTVAAKEIWVLDTNSTATIDGGTVVATFSGVGRWVLITSSALVSSIKTDVIYKPSVGASAGLILKTWAEVEAAAVAADSLLRVWFGDANSSIPATANTVGSGMMEWHSGLGVRVNVTIDPGGLVTGVGLFKDVSVTSDTTANTPLAFAAGEFRMENAVIRPANASAAGQMFQAPALSALTVYVDQDSILPVGAGGAYAASVPSGSTLNLKGTRGAVIGARAIFAAAGSVVNSLRDASVDSFIVSGTGTVTTTLIDKANDAFFDDASVAPVIVVTPVAGGPSIQQAIDALKPKITPFTNASLVAGILTITHGTGVQFLSRLIVSDDGLKQIAPDNVTYTSATQVDIDLTSFGVIAGTWNVSLGI